MKQGYKQTEIGVIPEDWEVRDFGEVGSYYKGGGISMREVRPVGLPCIMYGDIYVKFDTSFKECDYRIGYDTAKNSVKASPQDLFFTASGETADDIGRCVSYQGEDDIYIGGDIIALHPSNEYDSLFLAYVQNSEKVKKQKASFAQGHSVVHISTDNIKKTLFAAPKHPEQKRIAKALSDVDELITSLEKLIEKKKALKQGVMQELLTGKRRLPGFTEEWITMKVESIVSRFATGLNPRSNFKLNAGGDNYYVTIKNFKDGVLYLDDNCDKIDDLALQRINERSDLKKQALYLRQKPADVEKLIEIAKIQSTESSNEIEGIRTTDTRLRQLMNEKTMPRTRDEKEIAGYRDALNTVHENFEYIPLTPNYIIGKCGTGKTSLASHLGRKALAADLKVSYNTVESFLYTLETKDHVHKQLQRYKYWLSCSLIIIDDMMYTGLSDEELMLFYHTVMLLNETRSIIIITNRELSGWGQSGNDRHLMQTLIERLSANSQQIRLT